MSVRVSQRSHGSTARRALSRTLRPLQAAVRRQLLRLVDGLVLLEPRGAEQRKVLLVRLDNIGDFVLWLDAARALVAHFRAEGFGVALLANAAWAELARDVNLFDDVIALKQEAFKRDLGHRRRTLQAVRAAGYCKVIQPTVTRVPEMGDAVVRVSGAAERVGVASAADSLEGVGVYTRLISLRKDALGELPANAAFVRELTGIAYRARVADLRQVAESVGVDGVRLRLPASPYVVLFPGASEAGKRWPARSFEEIAMRCVRETGCHVVICGGPGDEEVAARIADACGDGVTSLAGQTSLSQLAGVLGGASLLVSNDTAAVHMAAALGVPSVCIVGGGHYGRFLPYEIEVAEQRPMPRVASQPMECFGCGWTCKFHPPKGEPMPCVQGVSADAVWELASPVLATIEKEMSTCV